MKFFVFFILKFLFYSGNIVIIMKSKYITVKIIIEKISVYIVPFNKLI